MTTHADYRNLDHHCRKCHDIRTPNSLDKKILDGKVLGMIVYKHARQTIFDQFRQRFLFIEELAILKKMAKYVTSRTISNEEFIKSSTTLFLEMFQ